MNSLRKSFKSYGKHPFNFVWSGLLYLLLQIVFILGAVGFFLIFFFVASTFSIKVVPSNINTQIAIGIVAFILLFFMTGLNAALIKSYSNALEGAKTSLREYFEFSIQKAPMFFAIMLIREIVSVIFIGPVIYIWMNYLQTLPYINVVVGLYSLFMLFMIHMLFTPPLISSATLGTSFIQSLRTGFSFVKRKHIFFIMLYALFAGAWLFNFIPILGLVSIFVLYPILYSSMITMFLNRGIRTVKKKKKRR